MGRSGGEAAGKRQQFGSMEEFWGFYLSQHSKPGTRRWHFLGTLASLACAVLAAATGRAAILLAGPVLGYGMAWYSHFFVEGNSLKIFRMAGPKPPRKHCSSKRNTVHAWKSLFTNRPVTFGHPVWSFICDHRMFVLILTGRIDAELARFRVRPTPDAAAASAHQD
ncbi:uncharacterized protein [Miscanthus floridulus]|uniref:uncharacterized protein n=1 Tax=Miscanthus floridulus TaxID=154761 RepID=UPI003459FEC5